MDNIILLLIILNIAVIITNVLILSFGSRLIRQTSELEDKIDGQSRLLLFAEQRHSRSIGRSDGC